MKTINKAAKEFVNTNFAIDDNVQEEELIKSFEAGVKFAEQWISVKDEIPEDRTRIVFEDFAGINTISGVYEKTTNTVRSKYLTVSFDIAIHWRPINKK